MNRANKKISGLFLAILISSGSLWAQPREQPLRNPEIRFHVKSPDPSPKIKKTPTDILVKFKSSVKKQRRKNLLKSNKSILLHESPRGRFMRIKSSENISPEQLVAHYQKLPEVEYAEVNHIVRAHFLPNDPYYSYQWHLHNSDQGGIQMPQAWDIQTGDPDVIVAVIDTGVAYENYEQYIRAPDLANTSFVPGYDFINNDEHPNDDKGHGTHVTGTIAQSTNNAKGVAGIAFHCSIMPVKVLGEDGSGTDAGVADGIYFATDNGAHVINMSLGGEGYSVALANAVQYAQQHGVIVVCSMGNEYLEGNPILYPAAYDQVIAVGATRYDKSRAYYSSTGPHIDIAAPGGDVTVDQNADGYGDGILQQTFNLELDVFSYWFYQGTSMAAPHVSALAALLISRGVSDPDKVRQIILDTATDLGTPGWDQSYGAGLINAQAALQYAIPGDLTGDLEIDIEDLFLLLTEWKQSIPPLDELNADSNNDNIVNLLDFAPISQHWLE